MPRLYVKKPMLDRLSKHVKDDKTGCWNWTGSKDKDGYGRMISGEKGRRVFSFAHRESYKFYKGEIGAPGGSQGCVLHKVVCFTLVTTLPALTQNTFTWEIKSKTDWIRRCEGGPVQRHSTERLTVCTVKSTHLKHSRR